MVVEVMRSLPIRSMGGRRTQARIDYLSSDGQAQQMKQESDGLNLSSSTPSTPPRTGDVTQPTPRQMAGDPTLTGRRVALRPIKPSDYEFLYSISTAPENLVRWRYRGATPSSEAFTRSLWQGVLTQFVITRAGEAEPLGLIVAYNADLRNQTVYAAVMLAPSLEKQGWVLDATALFLVFLFQTWPFRKIYYEMLEFNYARIASGEGRHFCIEGRLREHEFHDGRYWDFFTLAVYREGYLSLIAPVWDQISGLSKP